VAAIARAGGRSLSAQPIRQSLEEHFIREMGPPRPAAAGLLVE
jgi:hypothetical protein